MISTENVDLWHLLGPLIHQMNFKGPNTYFDLKFISFSHVKVEFHKVECLEVDCFQVICLKVQRLEESGCLKY